MGAGTLTKPSAHLPRGYWRWQPHEDRRLAELKREGARHKDIARELGRTPSSIDNRVLLLCHREEELDTLERLLAEAQMPEVHGEEVE